jgi:hydroxymethylglutaryl-CoA reductase (NADPH)
LVFSVENITAGKVLASLVQQQISHLNILAKETSSHINLLDVTVKTLGTFAFVRLVFDTQDAMGMNMVTIAADRIGAFIAAKTKAGLVSVAGNFDVDKKPAWLNVIRGRGWEVRADARIPQDVVSGVLKTNARAVYEVWLAKCMVGSAISGSMAFNAHFANIVAALFLATGQDMAHVVEGSLGITTVEARGNGDLYISISMPDVLVGTVGGGTGLATQKEALTLLGVAGGDHGANAQKLASIVGGAVLAGELSLLASLSQGTLAQAHQMLARGKK